MIYNDTAGKDCRFLTYHKAENFCTGCKPNGFQIPLGYNSVCKNAVNEP